MTASGEQKDPWIEPATGSSNDALRRLWSKQLMSLLLRRREAIDDTFRHINNLVDHPRGSEGTLLVVASLKREQEAAYDLMNFLRGSQ